jgi:enterochelin esterase-like enzyme
MVRLFHILLPIFLLAAEPLMAQNKGNAKRGPGLAPLREAFNHTNTDAAELEALVFRTFSKQNLFMGKVGARMEDRTAAWAVINPSPSRILDAKGNLVGEMRPVGNKGAQVLVQDLPNFTNLMYRVEAGGMTLLAGEFHVELYTMPPEWTPSSKVPAGRIERFDFNESRVFPNTLRQVCVYVPSSYQKGAKSALFVWQDGSRHCDPNGQMRATIVMDHLIANKQMPPCIGVFIDPGRRPNQKDNDKPGNRGFEYDSLGDAYVRFVTEEVLPEVKKRYELDWSDDPKLRAIAGGSSGGICAFTAAWERPDQFGKVLSWVGSFVNLRGGHVYPALVRKAERKPLRVYLLDGSNDLDNPYGNWPLANLNMAAALKFAGYDYRFDYGECFHGSKGMSASLPDALRWLWRAEGE